MIRSPSRAIAAVAVVLTTFSASASAQSSPPIPQAEATAGVFDVCVTTLTGVLYAAREGRCFLNSHVLRQLTDAAGFQAYVDARVSEATAALRAEANAAHEALRAAVDALAGRVAVLEEAMARLGTVASTTMRNAGDVLTWTGTDWAPRAPSAASALTSPNGRYSVRVTDVDGVELISGGTHIKIQNEDIAIHGGRGIQISGGSIDLDGALATIVRSGSATVELTPAGGAKVSGNSFTADIATSFNVNARTSIGLKATTTLLAEGINSAQLRAAGTVTLSSALMNVNGALITLSNGSCPVARLGSAVVGSIGPAAGQVSGLVTTGVPTILVPCS